MSFFTTVVDWLINFEYVFRCYGNSLINDNNFSVLSNVKVDE